MNGLDHQVIQFVSRKNNLGDPNPTRFSSGVVNRVYKLADRYVLKIEGEADIEVGHEILKPTLDLTTQLLAKGAKVPRIVDYDTVIGKRYILMEKARGNNLAEYQMTKELNWLKKYYPKLFSVDDLVNRVRLYYVDPLFENVIDYQDGRWSARALDKVTEKVRDFYVQSWLEKALS